MTKKYPVHYRIVIVINSTRVHDVPTQFFLLAGGGGARIFLVPRAGWV